jgi:hypothetical protein
MNDLSLGLAVSLAVALVVLVVVGLTAMFCNWIERSDREHANKARIG